MSADTLTIIFLALVLLASGFLVGMLIGKGGDRGERAAASGRRIEDRLDLIENMLAATVLTPEEAEPPSMIDPLGQFDRKNHVAALHDQYRGLVSSGRHDG